MGGSGGGVVVTADSPGPCSEVSSYSAAGREAPEALRQECDLTRCIDGNDLTHAHSTCGRC